jgi:hypothetical protein
MFRRSILALAAVSTLGAAAMIPSAADAHWSGRYGWYGKNYHYAPYSGYYGYRYVHPGWKHGGWRHYGWRKSYWY